MTINKDNSNDSDDGIEAARIAAATLIQRLWRGRNNNKAKDEYLNADLRWDDTATQVELKVNRDAALEGKNTPTKRWKRAAFFAGQLQYKNDIMRDEGVDTDAEEKYLETQHWLELIDGKHRMYVLTINIGTVKYYHKTWEEADTTDNFFKWLDGGDGKDLSLDECPRERLEKERIIYLSAEQRLNYLVRINPDGKLYWAKNNQLVDTSEGDWKDAGHGQGIIPENVPSQPIQDDGPTNTDGPFSAVVRPNSTKSSDQSNAATHYAGPPKGKYKWSRYLRRHFTSRGVMQRLLRKTVKRNTWIYVSDKNFNIFIGIKETGTFQHSSFLAGGIVTSAGLISVKKGVIYTLSPLSGHYRTSVNHFHKFIDVLAERGVDMHKVRISKAEAALWGIGHLAKFKKARSHAVSAGKEKITHAPHQVKALFSSHSEKNDKHRWKSEILSGRKSSAASQEKSAGDKETRAQQRDHGSFSMKAN